MGSLDVFAAPTPVELEALKKPKDLFAPPTEMELAAISNQAGDRPLDISGAIESFGKGIAAVSPEPLAGLQAGLEPLTEKVLDLATGGNINRGAKALAAIGIKDPGDKDFSGRKAENILRQEQFKKDNPNLSYGTELAGNIAGGAATASMLPSISLDNIAAATLGKKGITKAGIGAVELLKSIGPAALGSGALGAIKSPDQYGGISDGLNLDKRLENAKSDALITGALGAAPYIVGGAKNALKSLASSSSGIPLDEINNLASRVDKVKELYNEGGKDFQTIADNIRDKTITAVNAKKSELNGIISNELKNSSPDKIIPTQPLTEKIKAYISELSPNYNAEDIKELQSIITNIENEGAGTGALSIKELNATKKYLQSIAEKAYNEPGLFSNAKEVARVAKDGARDARLMLNEISPNIAQANNTLSYLHDIDEALSPSVLKESAAAGKLFSVGTGANASDIKQLERLDSVVGTNTVQSAKDMATARTFYGNGATGAGILPQHPTGRSLIGPLVGGALGGPLTAALGAAIASPLAIRTAIEASQIAAPLAKKISELSISKPQMAAGILNGIKDDSNNGTAVDFFRKNPSNIDDIPDPAKRLYFRDAVKKQENAISRRMRAK